MATLDDWVQAEIAKELEELDLATLKDVEQPEEPAFVSKTAAEVLK